MDLGATKFKKKKKIFGAHVPCMNLHSRARSLRLFALVMSIPLLEMIAL